MLALYFGPSLTLSESYPCLNIPICLGAIRVRRLAGRRRTQIKLNAKVSDRN
jgi:hypothetical protein